MLQVVITLRLVDFPVFPLALLGAVLRGLASGADEAFLQFDGAGEAMQNGFGNHAYVSHNAVLLGVRCAWQRTYTDEQRQRKSELSHWICT